MTVELVSSSQLSQRDKIFINMAKIKTEIFIERNGIDMKQGILKLNITIPPEDHNNNHIYFVCLKYDSDNNQWDYDSIAKLYFFQALFSYTLEIEKGDDKCFNDFYVINS